MNYFVNLRSFGLESIIQENKEFLLQAEVDALYKSQAVIKFTLDGVIEWANDNFLSVMGYQLEEIQGQHHSMFADTEYAQSAEYKQFWARLRSGEFFSGEYKRLAKGGKEVWIQASYNPILDTDGTPVKVVKFASDITASKQESAYNKGQIEAIGRSQAVIKFSLDGIIEWANDNFLSVMGYRLEEIQGKHHSMFAEPEYARSSEYKEFWRRLNRGEYFIGEYKRLDKWGKDVWIQASYNPLLDADGKPFKVVKYAQDITEQVTQKIYLQESVDSILEVVNAAASGDLTKTIHITGEDAIGRMGDGLKTFLSDLKNSISDIIEYSHQLAGSTVQLKDFSVKMGDNASQTSEQANNVVSAAATISANIQTVAAGAEEMSASIKTVAVNTNKASKVARDAVSAAGQTNLTMSKLGDRSTEIGNVVKVINSIAKQTNLLALNATIEAARAGEAGKGFAVVASEVKELATQTSRATEDISHKIEGVQHDIKLAIDDINIISKIIQEINNIQSTISTAVEEQTGTTSEIARNVHEAAKGSSEIAENITKVAASADSTSADTLDSLKSISELSQMARSLQEILGKFKY